MSGKQYYWNPSKWNEPGVPQDLDAVDPDDVVQAALKVRPEFIQGATHPFSQKERWDYTFYAYYRVEVNGWYVSLAVHRHVRTTGQRTVGRVTCSYRV